MLPNTAGASNEDSHHFWLLFLEGCIPVPSIFQTEFQAFCTAHRVGPAQITPRNEIFINLEKAVSIRGLESYIDAPTSGY